MGASGLVYPCTTAQLAFLLAQDALEAQPILAVHGSSHLKRVANEAWFELIVFVIEFLPELLFSF